MKNRRALIFFALAVSFGVAAALLVQRVLDQQKPVQTEARIDTTPVVVTKTALSQAAELSSQQLQTVDWPTQYLPQGSFADPDGLKGRVLRRALAKGETVQESSLLPEGSEGGLASVIQEQRRAVSVEVDPIIGVAGFVRPGSRVDVLVTLRRLDWGSKQPYAKVVLQNVKVLAIDQRLEEVRNGDPELVSVVTLEVKPDQAEKLTYMSHEGKLQLALRSPKDEEIVKTPGVIVSRLLGGAPSVRRSSVQVVKGASVTSKSF
jgi:pilus assembly protein CpaB